MRDRAHVQIFRDWMSTKAHLKTPGDCQSSVAPELTRSLPLNDYTSGSFTMSHFQGHIEYLYYILKLTTEPL